jgi:hypothetical protein
MEKAIVDAIAPLLKVHLTEGLTEIKSALDEVKRQQININARLEAIEKSSSERAAGVSTLKGVD